MSNLDKLIAYFEKFPGIGARQARRFAFHILTMKKEDVTELSDLISNLSDTVTECELCHRFFSYSSKLPQSKCSICSDVNRDHHKLLLVERDNDITPIERAGAYDGLYFVFGGTVPLLDNPDTHKLRSAALKARVEGMLPELSELILAFSVNPDGENTARYVRTLLKDISSANSFSISELGRGLSTGSELEYADPETVKNALSNRH